MAYLLVVDDQLVMRNMFKSILVPAGHRIDLAADGEEGYQLASLNNYDIVITDLYMPKLDGIGLTRQLRALPRYRGKPILVVSTEGATAKKNEGKAAGATGWIVKPISSDVLLPVIERLLG